MSSLSFDGPLNTAWTPLDDPGPGIFKCGLCHTAKWTDSTTGWFRWKPKMIGDKRVGVLICPGCVSTAHVERARLEAKAALKYLGS